MQKVFNVLTAISFGVSSCVVVGGAYVYLNKDALIESAKEKAMVAVQEAIGSALGGQLGGALLSGEADESLPVPMPSVPF